MCCWYRWKPGLPSLCFAEHMLFMGSTEFPDENEVCLCMLHNISFEEKGIIEFSLFPICYYFMHNWTPVNHLEVDWCYVCDSTQVTQFYVKEGIIYDPEGNREKWEEQ